MEIVFALFLVATAAVLGGVLARLVKVPSLVGYIVFGIIFGAILPGDIKSISSLAQIGTILLLFSIGVELSLSRLTKFFNIAVFGSLIQVTLTSAIGFLLLRWFGLAPEVAAILAVGFSLSSTAVLVKILSDKGEMDTIHGEIMFGWSLVQDLMVIPVMVIMPLLVNLSQGWLAPIGLALAKSSAVILVTIILGNIIIPFLVRKVSEANSRELLLLLSVALALGTAGVTSLLGISPALGAFLAGVVISGSGEHHAIFAEIRPLRDLFVALFFVSLGFLVNLGVVIAHLPLIVLIAISVILLKAIIVFVVSGLFGYRGKTAVANSFGLAQVGEFAFVIFSGALALGIISQNDTSLGISVTLLTLIISPVMYSRVLSFWRKAKDFTGTVPLIGKLFVSGEKRDSLEQVMEDHIIICGYGRVGKWVGKALTEFNIPFIVVDYNQEVVAELKNSGVAVLYGDPVEPEVLEAAGVRNAKALVLAIPDRMAQETLIAYAQTVAPNAKIISRVHKDEDWEKFKTLRVDKLVQPEFEAAVAIVRSILGTRGKTKDEISEAIKSLRVSHSR